MSNLQDKDTISEQVAGQEDCLYFTVEKTGLPEDGYKQAGGALFTTLNTTGTGGQKHNQKLAKWVEKALATNWLVSLLTTVYVVLTLGLIWKTPLSHWLAAGIDAIAGRFADIPGTITLYRIPLGILVLLLIITGAFQVARHTDALLAAWIASMKPRMIVQLSSDGETDRTQATITTSPEIEQSDIQSDYKELKAPLQFRGGTTSVAELLGAPAEEPAIENLHAAEWSLKEQAVGAALATEEATLLGEGSTYLPLDKIAHDCHKTEAAYLVQVVVIPRVGDDKRVAAEMDALKTGKPTNKYLRALHTIQNVFFGYSDNSTSRRTREEMSAMEGKRYDGLEETNRSSTFDVRIRALVWDPESDYSEDAQSIFESIENAFETATNDQVTLRRETPTSDATKRAFLACLINKVHTSAPQLSNITNLRSWKRALSWRTPSQGIIADSHQIWSFVLLSTETGEGRGWSHGAPPQDQQPTDLPAEDKLDQFRVGDGSDPIAE